MDVPILRNVQQKQIQKNQELLFYEALLKMKTPRKITPLATNLGDLMTKQGFVLPVGTVFLHRKFHTDEAVCFWISRSQIFRDSVQKVFPGIDKAEVIYWSLGQSIPASDTASALSFGCRSGRADEHGLADEEYRKTCAAEMFAQIVGLGGDPVLRKMIGTVIREDRLGADHKKSLHAVLKGIHRMSKDTRPRETEILEWLTVAYEAQYLSLKADGSLLEKNPPMTLKNAYHMIKNVFGELKAKDWITLALRSEKNRGARSRRMFDILSADRQLGTRAKFWSTIEVARGPGKTEHLHMVVIKTDTVEAVKVAIDLGAAVVIKMDSNGNVVIFTDRRKSIDLTTVILALRDEELRLMWDRGEIFTDEKNFSPEELSVRGHVEGWPLLSPYWFLHNVSRNAANQLYNGSESAEGVAPTAIPLEVIVEIVRLILGGKFHPVFYEKCGWKKGGTPGWCSGEKCPWFHWHLGRCLPAQRQTEEAERRREKK